MKTFLKIIFFVVAWAFAFLIFFETFPKSSQERWIDNLKGISTIAGFIVTILILPPISQKNWEKVKNIISNTFWVIALYLSFKFLGAAETLYALGGPDYISLSLGLLLPIISLLAIAITGAISTYKNKP